MHKLLADIECTIIHTWHGVSKNSVIIQLKILAVSQVRHHWSPYRCTCPGVRYRCVTGSCPLPQLLSFNIHHGPEKNLQCLWKFIIKFLQRLTTSSKRAASLPDLIRHKITLYNRAGSSLHQCQCTYHSYQPSNSPSFLLN